MVIILALAFLGQSILADVPAKNIEKAFSKANPVATCQVGADCESRWLRAQKWVIENSRFTLVVNNDHQILTRGAIYANTDASYAVAMDAPLNGMRTIRFRAWCGNFIACIPKPETLRRLFVQTVNSPPPDEPK